MHQVSQLKDMYVEKTEPARHFSTLLSSPKPGVNVRGVA